MHPPTHRWKRLRSCWIASVYVLLWLCACDNKPQQGHFRVTVQLLDQDQKAIAQAAVFFNDKPAGVTDRYGIMTRFYKGKVHSILRVRVQANDESLTLKRTLQIRQTPQGWRTVPIKVEALLNRSPALPLAKRPHTHEHIAPKHTTTNTKTPPIRLARRTRQPHTKQKTRHHRRKRHVHPRTKRNTKHLALRTPPTPNRAIPTPKHRHLPPPRLAKQPIPPASKKPSARKLAQLPVHKLPCFRRHRRKRTIVLHAMPGTRLLLKSACQARLRISRVGAIKVEMPQNTFQRLQLLYPNGEKRDKVLEIKTGRAPLNVYLRPPHKICDLPRIQKKTRHNITLEQDELQCLQRIQRGHPQHFSAYNSLGRYYCQRRQYTQGKSALRVISNSPRSRFDPYRALTLGLNWHRCKRYDKAILFLRRCALLRNGFHVNDRYNNSKALYTALSITYERNYYRNKDHLDLLRAKKSLQSLLDLLKPHERNKRQHTKRELKRIQTLIREKGALEN